MTNFLIRRLFLYFLVKTTESPSTFCSIRLNKVITAIPPFNYSVTCGEFRSGGSSAQFEVTFQTVICNPATPGFCAAVAQAIPHAYGDSGATAGPAVDVWGGVNDTRANGA